MAITKATASSVAPAAKGDLVVGSGTNDAAVLGVGSANQVLTVDSSTGTGLKWQGFVGCALAKTSQQTLTNFAYTAITFTQEDIDTNGFHDNSTNTSRITIPSGYAGKYQFGCHATTNSGDNSHTMAISKNGTNEITLGGWKGVSTGNGNYAATILLDLAVNDYVEFRIYVQSTTVVDSTAQNARPTIFYAQYLGA